MFRRKYAISGTSMTREQEYYGNIIHNVVSYVGTQTALKILRVEDINRRINMSVKKIESLNKHTDVTTNENEFNIENYMNANWDKLIDVVDNNADELSTLQAELETLKETIANLQSTN